MNIAATVDFRRRWAPDALAITAGGRSLRWAQLDDETRHVGSALRDLGIGVGDRVGILGANSLEWCVLAIAVLRVGAIVVPMNLRSTPSELTYITDKVAARAVAFDAAGAGRFAPVREARPEVLCLSLDGRTAGVAGMADLRTGAGDITTEHLAGSAPAVIPFTSGTTGYPKGVTLTHENIRSMAEAYTRFDGWGSDSVSLCFAPLAFNGGVTNAFLGTFLVGGRLILEEFEPGLALRRIVEERVTVMSGVPLVYQAIAELPEFADADLSSVVTATTGGAVVHDALLRTWADKGVRLRQSYGLTEATGPMTIIPPDQFRAKAHTAGVPGTWDRIRVVDEAGGELGPGEVGEIVISGPQVMAGYWGDPEATAAAIRDGWLHTGDLGRFDADGYLSIVDRKKDLIISGGINVYPAEIERVCGEFPGVTECVAFGVPHERWGETVAVMVAGPVDLAELYAHAKRQLSDYKVPRWFAPAKEPLPRSSFGKLLRRAAAALFDADAAYRTPST
jgi:fatty-acyl-CoA synthase